MGGLPSASLSRPYPPPERGCHGAMGKDDATVAKSSTLPFEGLPQGLGLPRGGGRYTLERLAGSIPPIPWVVLPDGPP